jgi:hypothetical protein
VKCRRLSSRKSQHEQFSHNTSLATEALITPLGPRAAPDSNIFHLTWQTCRKAIARLRRSILQQFQLGPSLHQAKSLRKERLRWIRPQNHPAANQGSAATWQSRRHDCETHRWQKTTPIRAALDRIIGSRQMLLPFRLHWASRERLH